MAETAMSKQSSITPVTIFLKKQNHGVYSLPSAAHPTASVTKSTMPLLLLLRRRVQRRPCSEQTALVDDHRLLRLICAALDLDALYLVHHVHPLGHAPKGHVAVVRPACVVLDGDEESVNKRTHRDTTQTKNLS